MGDLRKAVQPVALTTLFRMYVHAFDINDLRRLADDVNVEDQSSILDPDQHAALLNAVKPAALEPFRIGFERSLTALFEYQFGVYRKDERQIRRHGPPDPGNRLARFDGPSLLE